MTQFTQPLNWGFSLLGEATDRTLSADESLEIVALLSRMSEFTEHRTHHHYFCARMMEFLEKVRKQYRDIGHSVKLQSVMPISVMRYHLADHPTCQAYRFANIIYRNGKCATDVTVPFKLKDHIQAEIKTVFDVTYALDMSTTPPTMRRFTYQEEAAINDLISTIRSVDHPAFVLLAIRNLAKMEHDRSYRGKIFTVKITEGTGGDFTIHFTPNKPQGDGVVFCFCNGRMDATLITPVNKVPLEITDQFLFEMFYNLQREVYYQSDMAKSMRRLREYKYGKGLHD